MCKSTYNIIIESRPVMRLVILVRFYSRTGAFTLGCRQSRSVATYLKHCVARISHGDMSDVSPEKCGPRLGEQEFGDLLVATGD